jgi:cytidylate kinase
MALVTIDGHIGAGGAQVGRRIAKMLDFEYVDRLFLPGSETLASSMATRPSLSERLWSAIEKAVRGMALGNAAGDPYFVDAGLAAIPLTWDHSPGAPMLREPADATNISIAEVARRGRAVLVHRAGAVALRGHERVVRIGLFASWEDRVKRVMHTEGIVRASDAERVIRRREEAQAKYFGARHGAHPEDESLYDLCLNTSREQISVAALKVTRLAQQSLGASA